MAGTYEAAADAMCCALHQVLSSDGFHEDDLVIYMETRDLPDRYPAALARYRSFLLAAGYGLDFLASTDLQVPGLPE